MDNIDYSAKYWFLVETGHLKGGPFLLGDLFKFHPKGQYVFTEIVLFDNEERAKAAAALIDRKEARVQLKMKLEAKMFATPVTIADTLERLSSLGVHYVSFDSGSGQSESGIPIDLVVIGFRSV